MPKGAPDKTGTGRFILKKHEVAVLSVSIFMISFAVLSTQISLTRMFSVMFAYHYAFLAVAIAFAGLGLGGILAQLVFSREPSKELISGMTIVCTVFTLVVSLSTIIATSSSSPNFIATSILFFISFLPAGLFLATAYKSFARHSNVLYGADIAGAALGSDRSIEDKKVLAALRQKRMREIVLVILENGKAKYQLLAERLKLSHSTLSSYLKYLVNRNILAREKIGYENLYTVREEDRVAKVLIAYKPSFLDKLVDRALDTWMETHFRLREEQKPT